MTAEWRPDPEGRFEWRWWDGQQWTDQVAHQGQAGVAPLGQGDADVPTDPAARQGGAAAVDPVQSQVVQGPGDQARPAQQQPAYQQPAQQQPAYEQPVYQQPVQGQPGSDFAGISGDLVDGRYGEREATPIGNQNTKMLRVRVGEPFMARQGSMVAYQGNVQFAFQGGGAAKFLKKALTGEGLPLMQVSGQGDVFLAELAHDVHLLQLSGAGLSVSGKNVLAFSASLDWNIERVKGGGIATGGLFNTSLRGTGWVAITTDGPPVVLNAGEAPTFADTQAVVAWSADLQTQLKASFSAGALIGRGSGEAFQVGFHGQGFVIVQPSEGIQIPTSS